VRELRFDCIVCSMCKLSMTSKEYHEHRPCPGRLTMIARRGAQRRPDVPEPKIVSGKIELLANGKSYTIGPDGQYPTVDLAMIAVMEDEKKRSLAKLVRDAFREGYLAGIGDGIDEDHVGTELDTLWSGSDAAKAVRDADA